MQWWKKQESPCFSCGECQFREADEWELSDDNPNHYKPTCIAEEPWWNEVKDREIKEWNIIGGGMYKVELWIDLEEE
jgi:hypothetical protein